MTHNILSAAPGQLRPSALARGRGFLQLLKIGNPVAGANLTRIVPGDYWERAISLAVTLTPSAAAGRRSLNYNLLDGDGNIFNQTQIAAGIQPSAPVTQYGDLNTVSPVQGESSLTGQGSQTSPAANTTIANIATPGTGSYIVYVYFTLAGTVAQGVDANNIQLFDGGVVDYEDIENNIGTALQTFGPFLVDVAPGGSIALKNKNLATVGAIYSAQIVATPAAYSGGFTMPDILLKSGWAMQIAVGNIQAADQLSGIVLLAERYPSSDIDALSNAYQDELAAEALGLHRG